MKNARKLVYLIIAILLFILLLGSAASAEGSEAGPTAEPASTVAMAQDESTPAPTQGDGGGDTATEKPEETPAPTEPPLQPTDSPAPTPAPTEVKVEPKPTPHTTLRPVTKPPDRPTPTPTAVPMPTPSIVISNSYEQDGVDRIVRESGGAVKGELIFYSDSKEFPLLWYVFNNEEPKAIVYDNESVKIKSYMNGYRCRIPFEINPQNAVDNQPYQLRINLRVNQEDQFAEKTISFVPNAEITVNGGAPIFVGDESITVSVKNRESGKVNVELHPKDDTAPSSMIPKIDLTDGEAVVSLAKYSLEKYDHITVTYKNTEFWDKLASKEFAINSDSIQCAPYGKARLFPSDESIVKIQMNCDGEKEARISFTDAEGNQRKYYPDRTGVVEIPYGQLKDVSSIACEYRQYARKWEYTLSFDGTEADLQFVLLPQLAFEEEELDEDADKITVLGTVPGNDIELLIDGQPADRKGEYSADGKCEFIWDETHYFHAGQTISARTKDDYDNLCETEPIAIQPIEPAPILISLEEIQDQFQEAGGSYYINQDNTQEIQLKGTAHKNRNLIITVDGAENQDIYFTSGADGLWSHTLNLTDFIGPRLLITVHYEAYPEPVSDPLKLYLDNTADEIVIHTALIDGTDQLEVTGEPYALFQLFVDGREEGDPVSADGEGRAVLKTGSPLSPLSEVCVEMTDLAGNSTKSAAGEVRYKALQINAAGEKTKDDLLFVSNAYDVKVNIAGSRNAKFDLYAAVQGTESPKIKLVSSYEITENGESGPIILDLPLLKEYYGEESQTVILYAAYTDGSEEEAEQEQCFLRYDPSCFLASDDISEKAQMRASAANFTVSGIAEPDAQVSLFIDGELVKEETADQEGAFTFAQLQSSLLRGKKNISIKARDAAGNEADLGPVLKQFSLLTWQQYVFLLTVGCLLFIVSLLGFISAKKEMAKSPKHYSTDTVHID